MLDRTPAPSKSMDFHTSATLAARFAGRRWEVTCGPADTYGSVADALRLDCPSMTTLTLRNRLRALLTPAERRLFARLDTPQKIQTYIEKLPPNFELCGDTVMSPRRMLRAR